MTGACLCVYHPRRMQRDTFLKTELPGHLRCLDVFHILLAVYESVVVRLWVVADVCKTTAISLFPLSRSLGLSIFPPTSLYHFILPYRHGSVSSHCLSLNMVFASCLSLSTSFVSFLDQSFTTINRCISQMFWILGPIF